jgi:hypothetical protein
MELDLLRKRASFVDCYVNRHRSADVMGGDLYLMPRKTLREPHPPTLVKFATAQQVHEALAIVEQETFSATASGDARR